MRKYQSDSVMEISIWAIMFRLGFGPRTWTWVWARVCARVLA